MPKSKRLLHHVAEMIATEDSLGRFLGQLEMQVQDCRDVSELFADVSAIAATQSKALRSRFAAIGGTIETDYFEFSALRPVISDYPVTSALSRVSAAVNQAITGYAMLRSIALRNRDSPLIGSENTGDLAEQHTKTYVQAAHRINQILHNVVLWELDRDNDTCRCTCPSCGVGVCMCAQGPRRTLSDIWAEAGPIANETCVLVHPPRPDSASARAGLVAGDRILEANGKALETHFVLQQVLSGISTGESVELRVKRISGAAENVSLVLR